MLSTQIYPESIEECLIWYSLLGLYPCYLLGALYLTGPILAWLLFGIGLYRILYSGHRLSLNVAHLIWSVGMLMMLLSLVVGHLQFEVGTIQLVKSILGWAKGWALLAVFVLCGALSIRFELLVRGCMWLCLQTLVLLPLFVVAWLLQLPQTPYVSPLQVIGGPGPEFFALSLYEIDPGNGLPRWRLFTPWAPALGLVANIFLILALEEQASRWRWVGIIAACCLVVMSQSRLALICLLFILILRTQLVCLRGHHWCFLLAVSSLLFAMTAVPLLELFSQAYESFRAARIDSTRVRDILARMALERWSSEAPWFGHGVVERGPHLVEYMPIGTHHTWYGLLFIKGITGLISLLLPMLVSLGKLMGKQVKYPLNRAALLCLGTLMLYTFGENIEILAYLFWPALLTIGMAHSHGSSSARPVRYRR